MTTKALYPDTWRAILRLIVTVVLDAGLLEIFLGDDASVTSSYDDLATTSDLADNHALGHTLKKS